MNGSHTSAGVVQAFFTAFGQGNLDALVDCFADDCQVHAVREGQRRNGEPYGTYRGKEGVRQFVAALGQTFDTKEFSVEYVQGHGEVAFAAGQFAHEVKPSGRMYRSAWALRCRVVGGKIAEYRFYEDSEAFREAAGA